MEELKVIAEIIQTLSSAGTTMFIWWLVVTKVLWWLFWCACTYAAYVLLAKLIARISSDSDDFVRRLRDMVEPSEAGYLITPSQLISVVNAVQRGIAK